MIGSFSIDADEVVSQQLKDEILSLKTNNPADGYKIPRLSYYMNRPIKHSGWYPDYQLRLFNRNLGKWKDREIHESVKMNSTARVKKLQSDILHFSVKSSAQHHKMIGERYAPLSAKLMLKNGRQTSPFKISTVGFTTFIRSFLIQGGFLDGLPGFCISSFAAHHAFLKHLMLWELQNKKSK